MLGGYKSAKIINYISEHIVKQNYIFRRQLFLFLSTSALLLALLTSGRVVNSQTVLAQNFLNTNYDSNYYGKMLEADSLLQAGRFTNGKKDPKTG